MNKQHAQLLIGKWVVKLGTGFHPDTPATDYFDANNEPSLTATECQEYKNDLDVAFAIMGDDVYGFTLDCFKAVAA